MPREHVLAPHRLLIAAVVFALAAVVFAALEGPTWWQRIYHPLRYAEAISDAARECDVDPYLVAAVINAESGFDPDEVSGKGAVGLMQLMPETAAEVAEVLGMDAPANHARLTDPERNIRIGTAHLADLLGRFGDVRTAIAAYNAGGGRVDAWLTESGGQAVGSELPYPETERFVERVVKEREMYERLYPDAF